MRLLLFIYCFSFCSIQAQLTLTETEFDLGIISPSDDRFVDILITNKGEKTEYLLSVKKPQGREVVYLFNRKIMEPDSSMILRLQVNPEKKGKFSYEIPFFLSDRQDPVTAKIKGVMDDYPVSNIEQFQGCPDFGSAPSEVIGYTFPLRVVVKDSLTGKPVENALVQIYGSGTQPIIGKTNRRGVTEISTTPGPYYITSSAENYKGAETGDYFNFRRNQVQFFLAPENKTNVVKEELDTGLVVREEELLIEIDENAYVKDEEVVKEEVEEQKLIDDSGGSKPVVILEDVPVNDFSEKYFNPVNIVFVLDISSSMKKQGRIALLKAAMHEFVSVLRPQDKVSFVAFSSDASVLLQTTSGSDKKVLHDAIDELEAEGVTSGSAGVKLAYRVAQQAYIEGGNNQVIIITDGIFNRGDDSYKKVIEKEKKKRDIGIAIAGIQTSDISGRTLSGVAELGAGLYVPIKNMDDAKVNLIKEVRRNAFKY